MPEVDQHPNVSIAFLESTLISVLRLLPGLLRGVNSPSDLHMQQRLTVVRALLWTEPLWTSDLLCLHTDNYTPGFLVSDIEIIYVCYLILRRLRLGIGLLLILSITNYCYDIDSPPTLIIHALSSNFLFTFSLAFHSFPNPSSVNFVIIVF